MVRTEVDDESRTALQESARSFVERRLIPLERQVEQGLDAETWASLAKECADLGFIGLRFPEEYGGSGAGVLEAVTVLREFGRTSHSFIVRLLESVDASLLFGTDEQKKRYIIPGVEGKLITAFALTETEAGSDAAALSTSARLDGDEWVLNGHKVFTTKARIADVIITVATNAVAASGRKELSVFIVPRGTPGLVLGAENDKMGLRGVEQSDVFYENCRIPRDNLIGNVGQGWEIVTAWVNHDRLEQAAFCLGSAERALDLAISYARTRHTFGKPLASHQAIQWMIADSVMECMLAAEMIGQTCRERDQGLDVTVKAASAKLFAAEAAGRVIDRAIQIHGGAGYMRDLPLDMLQRDVRLARIGGGTAEMMRLIISRAVLRHGAAPVRRTL